MFAAGETCSAAGALAMVTVGVTVIINVDTEGAGNAVLETGMATLQRLQVGFLCPVRVMRPWCTTKASVQVKMIV